MTEVPSDWALYARYQQRLAKCSSLDDVCFGLEAGLNAILDGKSVGSEFEEGDAVRSISSATRRNRHGSMLRRKFATDLTGGAERSHLSQLEARSDMSKLMLTLSSEKYRLLMLVGYGDDRSEIASNLGLNSATVRARISRARSEARQSLIALPRCYYPHS